MKLCMELAVLFVLNMSHNLPYFFHAVCQMFINIGSKPTRGAFKFNIGECLQLKKNVLRMFTSVQRRNLACFKLNLL